MESHTRIIHDPTRTLNITAEQATIMSLRNQVTSLNNACARKSKQNRRLKAALEMLVGDKKKVQVALRLFK